MKNNELSQELLKTYFDYKDGFLYWKIKRSNRRVGDLAGCKQLYTDGDRYAIRVNGKLYLSSRLIYLWHNGVLPVVVDHINHNTLDDRIENLRAASSSQNSQNKTSHINSSSKYLGVHIYKSRGLWQAQIQHFSIRKHLGYFKTEEEAALAYNKAAILFHGDFANLNIIKP